MSIASSIQIIVKKFQFVKQENLFSVDYYVNIPIKKKDPEASKNSVKGTTY